jgi:hypothetical protein
MDCPTPFLRHLTVVVDDLHLERGDLLAQRSDRALEIGDLDLERPSLVGPLDDPIPMICLAITAEAFEAISATLRSGASPMVASAAWDMSEAFRVALLVSRTGTFTLLSMRDDGGPSAFFDHHPAAAFIVLEIGPIAVPCSGHAVMAERGLAVRHARFGRADHGVSAGRAHGERDEDERKAELQHVSHGLHVANLTTY